VNESEMPAAITRWLKDNAATLDDALPNLVSVLYGDLKTRAHFALKGAAGSAGFQTTDLVNETYLRLTRAGSLEIKDRSHFLALAAKTMRWVLMDSARASRRVRRGGGAEHLPFEESAVIPEERADELLALDDAITQLGELDARLADVVEYRVFGGLSVEDTSRILGVSQRTVKRDWRAARAFLSRELGRSSQ